MRQLEACPITGATDLEPLFNCKDFTVTGETFPIVQCKSSGFIFTNPVPAEDEIARYYASEEYISHSNTRKGFMSWLYQRVRKYTLNQKARWIRQETGTHQGNFLDIGCGTGEFLQHMNRKGWRGQGLEPSEKARSFAQNTYNLPVAPPEELFNLAAGKFRLITMWHVLEHVHQLNAYMEQLHTLLADDGLLVIAVPNCNSHDAEYYKAHWAAWDVPRHLYHFTADTMKLLAGKHGFNVFRLQRMPFDSYYVSLLSEKYLHGKPRYVSAFLKGWKSNREARRNVARSSSITYFLRKEA